MYHPPHSKYIPATIISIKRHFFASEIGKNRLPAELFAGNTRDGEIANGMVQKGQPHDHQRRGFLRRFVRFQFSKQKYNTDCYENLVNFRFFQEM